MVSWYIIDYAATLPEETNQDVQKVIEIIGTMRHQWYYLETPRVS